MWQYPRYEVRFWGLTFSKVAKSRLSPVVLTSVQETHADSRTPSNTYRPMLGMGERGSVLQIEGVQ